MLQEALNRWYRPLLHFFGPSDRDSQHSEKLMKWKVKLASNDDMRNQFLDQYVPKIYELGLTLPDRELRRGDDGIWVFGGPDWDEFKRVINGDGPCNKERLKVRRYAELAHRWVREALINPRRSM
jgi:ring-1,2-phenylacetyl-CoA epoxidase subunit PaaA